MNICVTITARSPKELRAAMFLAFQQGADLCELRLDRLDNCAQDLDVDALVVGRPGPVVVTVRRPSDGGSWRGCEDERRALLLEACDAGVEWIDVESDVAAVLPRVGATQRLVSVHDFRDTPPDLPGLLASLARLPGDAVKIAVTPVSWADVLRVMNAAWKFEGPAVCLSMGSLGTVTRMLAGRFGAPWTYAAMNTGPIAAPGQLRLREMRGVGRYDRIDEDTELFAVIGDPVAHSLSPAVHNAAFDYHDINAAYLALRVPSVDLPGLVPLLDEYGFSGFSVTIPHKQAIIEQAEGLDAIARAAGAANTLILHDDPDVSRWWATNTDLPAAIAAVERALGGVGTLAGRRVLILGAGGVAHAVAHGLAHADAHVTVSGRTVDKARALAERVAGEFVRWDQREQVEADVVINCTPVGMHPRIDATPIPRSALKAGTLVFDTVYTPERTMLIRDAEAQGCVCVTGVHMFVEQAALQYVLFAGRDAPRELMGEVVRRELARRAE